MAADFIATLRVQGYAATTLVYYERNLGLFVDHILSEGKDVFATERNGPAAVDYACLLRWLQKLRLTNIKEVTLQGHKSVASSWYTWLVRVGKVDRNPIEMLPALKIQEVDPCPLPPADTEKILAGIRQMNWLHKERNRAILELFYASGVRLNELRHLDLSDLMMHAEDPHVIIRHGKHKRQGIGLLNEYAVEAIQAWLPKRAAILRRWEKPADWKPLFVSRTGDRLGRWRIWNMVVQIGSKILGRRIHPHQFRHSFATDLLNRGADLKAIQHLLRHKKLATVERYLNVSTAHIRKAYTLHPRRKNHKNP